MNISLLYKYEDANFVWHFHIYLQRKFHAQFVEHEKGFITSGSGQFSL